MAIPAIVWGIIEVTAAAITAYEMYDLGKTLYEDIDKYSRNLEQAKEELRKKIQSIKEEIGQNIDENMERGFLAAMTEQDRGLQSETTKQAKGRTGTGSPDIITAIKQPIPFRKVIGMVCEKADKTPALGLRRKKGVTIKDLPKAKQKILLELLALSAEELAGINDIDNFIVVRLKQLVANFIFEFMDEMLSWKSPLKAEVCFGPRPKFDDPKLAGATRLQRAGTALNPFYPAPYRQRGSFSADLAIPDYRKDPLKKDNLFAVIEIKFPGDRIENKQFENYKELAIATAKLKTSAASLPRTNGKKGVTTGCRLALFRYPEDIAVEQKDSSGSKRSKRKTK
ncbi:hypothetical protein N8I74_02575 [Chitiniphilus purpureus]|uniref:VRR-NUC domain-containing protein n=1 Tax=Chitiniphilus purpureus TaxID=2981137 RepID=A0ABY6DNK7_9NEIS|nr:hypothetical protein [Chitiniphilus sp. CD1]UXY15922.1 hypothetical protein N8I74_02575 [Chitiniphilus sp. CD1]